ncbi:MAG: glycosyltransferase [Pseudobutyrivibrio sp.]|nr:glycosyltransferase [Pseudobutyrivibrio sp.]
MGRPLVSVIMGVYNQWDEGVLREAVDSILNQSYENIEFIIWDDGSKPEAARIVKDLEKLDKRILVMRREENMGLAASLNECILVAKGKYIARMDADDISAKTRIERQVDFLENNLEYAWCGTNTELFDETGVWGQRPYPEVPTAKDYYKFSPYAHPSVVFRAEVFDAGRGYLATDETLRCEDYEIFMHLVQRGLQGYNLQENLFKYRETKDSYGKRKTKFRINEAKIRYRNFKQMGTLFPIGWLFVLRPLAACLLPPILIEFIKRSEGTRRIENDRKQADVVQINIETGQTPISGFAAVAESARQSG